MDTGKKSVKSEDIFFRLPIADMLSVVEKGGVDIVEFLKTENQQLRKVIDEKTRLAEDYHTKYMYLQAEFDNYRKYMEKHKIEYMLVANEKLITKLLDVLDNFERALSTITHDKQVVQGIEMIYNEFYDILAKEGLEPINAVGEPFDPNKHEAYMVVENDELPEDTIVEELQKGYMLNKKVIRTSKVTVSKKSVKKQDDVKN